MPMTKNDGKGVFKKFGRWFYRTYADDDRRAGGPYSTRAAAMEALLEQLGFDVQEED